MYDVTTLYAPRLQSMKTSAECGHTSRHQLQNQLRIRNVAASEFILADFEAHGRIRAGHLIYSRQARMLATARDSTHRVLKAKFHYAIWFELAPNQIA